jgi:hypothetical protein
MCKEEEEEEGEEEEEEEEEEEQQQRRRAPEIAVAPVVRVGRSRAIPYAEMNTGSA